MEDKELDIYRSGVKKLLESKINQIISNIQPGHAAILYEQFFEHAIKKVRILCGSLSPSVFGKPFVIEAARAAINRGVEIEIIIEQEKPTESDFVKQLLSLNNSNISTIKDTSELNHFAVMDDTAFRSEYHQGQKKAFANMYDPEISTHLVTLFDTYRARSYPVK